MKENLKFDHLTLEELQAKHKQFKAFVIILSITTLIVLFGLSYSIFKYNDSSLVLLCGGSSIALLLCSFVLRQIEVAIKSRDLK